VRPGTTAGHPDAQLDLALALYRAELNERLVVHWTGGAWRVPLTDRHLAVVATDGSTLGRIICAGPADAQRAVDGLRPAPIRLDDALRALAPFAPLLDRLRALEQGPGAARPAFTAAPAWSASGAGPWVLYSAAACPVENLLALLVAGAARGVIWKPAPGTAASAHLLIRALGPVAGDSIALVQGDHASGQALARLGAPIWASTAPIPPGLN
jgi:hypothetical protein